MKRHYVSRVERDQDSEGVMSGADGRDQKVGDTDSMQNDGESEFQRRFLCRTAEIDCSARTTQK